MINIAHANILLGNIIFLLSHRTSYYMLLPGITIPTLPFTFTTIFIPGVLIKLYCSLINRSENLPVDSEITIDNIDRFIVTQFHSAAIFENSGPGNFSNTLNNLVFQFVVTLNPNLQHIGNQLLNNGPVPAI